MGAQKIPTQKTYEINVDQDSLNIDFLGQIDNLTGYDYLQCMIRATNIPQYMIVTISKWPQKQ